MIHATAATKVNFEKIIDKYGDYYTKPCEDVVELKTLLDKIKLDQVDPLAFYNIQKELQEEGLAYERARGNINFEENNPLWQNFKRLFSQLHRK